jgi:hypothetical protein
LSDSRLGAGCLNSFHQNDKNHNSLAKNPPILIAVKSLQIKMMGLI